MTSTLVGNGRGIRGLVRYLVYERTTDQAEPQLADRVEWTNTLNSPTDDIDLTVRIMQSLTADAQILKGRSGGSNHGRKLQKPYTHLVLSWPPGEEPPMLEQQEAVQGALDEIGLGNRISVWVAHNDRESFHIHVAASRIDPDDGRAADLRNAQLRLSAHASRFEAAHGGIRIPNRVARQEARERFSAELAEEMAGFVPGPDQTVREQAKERAKARREAISRLRASGRHTMPPMEPKRGPGRPERSQYERKQWSALYARQRAGNETDPEEPVGGDPEGPGGGTPGSGALKARITLSEALQRQRDHLAALQARGASPETRAAVDGIIEHPGTYQVPATGGPARPGSTRVERPGPPKRG